MAKTPDSVQFTVGVRGPSGKWEEIGTVDVPVSVVTRREGAFIDLARSRRIDNTPCPICGGDRLRTDFTGSGRCHAGPFAPGGITINNDPPERGLPPMTDRKRSAISGEFVTAEYADTHPDTTVSESRPARAEEHPPESVLPPETLARLREAGAKTGRLVAVGASEVRALLDAATERDRLAGLLDEVRRSGCAVEIAGVRIAPCDARADR